MPWTPNVLPGVEKWWFVSPAILAVGHIWTNWPFLRHGFGHIWEFLKMLKSIRWVGGAGTGKTTSLERLIEKMMGEFKDLRQIGFASFSRAARHEIVKRLCSRYGYDEKTIRNECWFRTLHSIAYSQSEIKFENVISPATARGQEWLSKNLYVQLSLYNRRNRSNEILTRLYWSSRFRQLESRLQLSEGHNSSLLRAVFHKNRENVSTE